MTVERLNLPDIPQWRPGALYWRPLDGGDEITVYPTVTGGGQLCKGPLADMGFNESWMYAQAEEALEAARQWDGEQDPPGKWLKATGQDQHGKQLVRRHGEPKVGEDFTILGGDEVETVHIWGNPMPERYLITRHLPNGNTLKVEALHNPHALQGVVRVLGVQVLSSHHPQPGDTLIYNTDDGEHVVHLGDRTIEEAATEMSNAVEMERMKSELESADKAED